MAQQTGSPSLARVAFLGRCPSCGKGHLFQRGLEVREACDACGQSYKFIDTGDGPAVFVIFILGFIALGGTLITNLFLGVPLWITYIVWGVLTALLAVLLLRLLKATLIALQWKHKAEEGRLAKD